MYQVLASKRSLTADTALRLARYFDTSPAFWMNLQSTYGLDVASQETGADLNCIPARKPQPVPEAQV
jgi:plasmid maintenance system antidote protein VapI